MIVLGVRVGALNVSCTVTVTVGKFAMLRCLWYGQGAYAGKAGASLTNTLLLRSRAT